MLSIESFWLGPQTRAFLQEGFDPAANYVARTEAT
jgi:hypothetical protein